MNRSIHIGVSLTLFLALVPGCHAPGGGVAGAPPSPRIALNDTEFAKQTFVALAKGDQSVANDIDWENFQVAGQDVGSKYSAFPDEPNRIGFRTAFVTSFSTSFHGSGGSETALTNWKSLSENPTQSVISVDTPRGTQLHLTISKKGGAQKLAGIQ